MVMKPEVPIEKFEVFVRGLDHPECCAFDKEGNLWAGGEAGQVYRISKAREVEEVARIGSFCGGLAFSPEQELFICVPKLGVVRVERSGRWTVFAEAANGVRLREANFPAFDSSGNLYVSDSGQWLGTDGRLVRFDAHGVGTEVRGGFGYANGLALSANEQFIFLIESDTNTVSRIPLSASLPAAPPEVYARPVGHVPDGMCMDAAGNLLVTSYGSHEIYRVSPDREVCLLAHDVNGILLGGPTNLAFGGSNYDEIYVANLSRWEITRARVGLAGLPPVNLRPGISSPVMPQAS
jgi:gluconolactonase